jgi:hypothetical protein
MGILLRRNQLIGTSPAQLRTHGPKPDHDRCRTARRRCTERLELAISQPPEGWFQRLWISTGQRIAAPNR